MEQHYSGAAIAVYCGATALLGNPIGSLLMAKARVDISFKSTYSKHFCLFRRLLLVGRWRRNRRHARFPAGADYQHHSEHFVMIKPVLGSSYRQYILSLGCRFISRCRRWWSVMRWALCERATGVGDAAGGANSRGCAAFVVMIVLSRHPLVVEVKRQFVAAKK